MKRFRGVMDTATCEQCNVKWPVSCLRDKSKKYICPFCEAKNKRARKERKNRKRG